MDTTPQQKLMDVFQALFWLAGIGFIAAFAISEWDGLRRFFNLLWDAVRDTPAFFGDMVTYYTETNGELLWPSLLFGAVVGAVLTVIVQIRQQKIIDLPSGGEIGLGILLAAVLTYLGMDFVLALGVGAVIGLALVAAFNHEFRAFLTMDNLRGLTTGRGVRVIGQSAFYGAIVGAFGAQLLMYPTQHCTFGGDIPRVQYQMGMVLSFIGALTALVPLWTVLGGGLKRIRAGGTSGYYSNPIFGYGLLLPTLVILVVFLYFPAVQLLTRSLERSRFPLPQTQFVCLDNYVTLSEDIAYQNSVQVTVFITLALVIITMSTALLIATLASQKVRGASVYRTLLIWPFALSPVVSGVIFLAMFREGDVGLINYFLDTLFGTQPRWFRDAQLAPWVVIMAAVWNGLGFNILFYIAGLQNIPGDLLEAAAIDGANVLQRFTRITIPLLSPFTFFLLVTNITYAFYGIYGAVDATTQGGPPLGPGGAEGGATDVLIYRLYQNAFGAGAPIGQAAAQAVVLFTMVALLTFLQFRFVERRVTYSS